MSRTPTTGPNDWEEMAERLRANPSQELRTAAVVIDMLLDAAAMVRDEFAPIMERIQVLEERLRKLDNRRIGDYDNGTL